MTLESDIQIIVKKLKELYEENIDINDEPKIIDLFHAIKLLENIVNEY